MPHEVQQLSSAFKTFKKDGDKFKDQPKLSSEVLLHTLTTQAAFNHYVKPAEPSIADKMAAPKDEGKVPPNHILNDLLRDELILNKLYEHVKSKMKSSAVDCDTFLLENNVQTNSEGGTSIDQLMVNKVLQEVHDDIQIGFRTAENHVEMLKGYSATQSD